MVGQRYFKKGIVLLVITILAIIYFWPILTMLISSFKETKKFFDLQSSIFPRTLYFGNYPQVFEMIPFWTYLKNTLIITLSCVVGIILSVTLVGYGFSRIQWKGRDVVFYLVLSTMMVPFFVTIIPLFTMFTKIGLGNTLWPLIIPAFFGNPLYIYIMREFFKTIPMTISEAARIDGCSEFQTFLKVCLPLVKLPVIVCVLFEIMFCWQDFLRPVIYLNSQSKYTLAIGLQQFFTLRGVEWGPLMAASVMISLPLIVMFFAFQKYFIAGITMTGLKD